MARANFVKAARKDYPEHGIKKGESYYWWKFRFGGKRMSKERPSRSQLTQSDKLAQLYDIDDELQDINRRDEFESREDFENWRDEVVGILTDLAERARAVGEEYEESRQNMESAFPSGCPTMDELEEKTRACESYADELESAASEIESIDWDDDEPADEQTEASRASAELDNPSCELI